MTDLQKTSAYGWLGPQTSGGGQLIFFYSSHPKADWPIARVYENDWDKLPDWLVDDVLTAEVDEISSGAPKKNLAISKGLLKFFPDEMPLYVLKDGDKVTKTIAWEESIELQAGKPQPAASKLAASNGSRPKMSIPDATQSVYLGFSDEDRELYDIVSDETSFKVGRAIGMVETLAENWSPEAKADLVRSILYESGKIFSGARGATLVSPDAVLADAVDEAKTAIVDGEIDTFMEDVADGNNGILDGEHARAVFEKLGIKSFTAEQKTSGEARIDLATKAWMFVDLTSKYGVAPATAKKLVEEVYDEIPF